MPRFTILAVIILAAACRSREDNAVALPAAATPVVERGNEPPVAINPLSPVMYPPLLAREGIEGTVLLRLFADSTGHLAPDSTKVAESSGYPALDSAALAAVPAMRFTPALRHGVPASTVFIQPVHFRNPGGQDLP